MARKDWKSIAFTPTVLIILLAAFIIRYSGIRFGFPLLTHRGEYLIASNAREIIQNRNLHPGFFSYPSLYIYSQSILYLLIYFVGRIFNLYEHFSDVGWLTLFFWGRLLTVVLSTLTIVLVYKLGRLMFDRVAALCSIIFISFSLLHVEYSYTITVNSPMAFWVILAFFMSVLIYTRGSKTQYYVLNGIFVGLAIGTKYLAVWSALPFVVAHYLNCRSEGRHIIDKRILIGLALIPIAFFITTPYAILDFDRFFYAVRFQYDHYRGGHAGFEGRFVTYGYYALSLLLNYGVIQVLLMIVGCYFLRSKDRGMFSLLIVFPLTYFLFIGAFRTWFDRNIAVLIPFLALLSGYGVSSIIKIFDANTLFTVPVLKKTAVFLTVLAISLGVSGQVYASVSHLRIINLPDTRLLAKRWVQENVPTCARIGRELYTAWLGATHPDELNLGYSGLIKQPLDKYDYLIASSIDYSRYVDNEALYPAEAEAYNKIFSSHELVKEFIPDDIKSTGPTIRIYKTRWSNPACSNLTRN